MKSVSRSSATTRDELEALVRAYRHVHEEHRRAHADGRVRRHLEARLRELDGRFEGLLGIWVPEDGAKAAWRAHLHGDAPEPPQPLGEQPLVFRGLAETGSTLEIRQRADGDRDVALDGRVVERLQGDEPLLEPLTDAVRIEDVEFHETLAASEAALGALEGFVGARERGPPWQHAAELLADGLIDRDFALTERGRRALARRS